MLRKEIGVLLRQEFSELFRNTRLSKLLTQEKMSEKLLIEPRSYQDLESGKSLCGIITYFMFKNTFPEVDLDYIDDLLRDYISGYIKNAEEE